MFMTIVNPRLINIKDFDYPLPESFIASHPAIPRDSARLLIAGRLNGEINEARFSEIAQYLPSNSLLLVNETRVVRARLIFNRSSGAQIEIFLLNPVDPADIQLAFASREPVVCKAFVGNARRWKGEVLYLNVSVDNTPVTLSARLVGRVDNAFLVQFAWEPGDFTFAGILEAAGKMPLPPYIKREATIDDASDYQTVYARQDGSVAAPTAGLHFTDEVMNSLASKGISTSRVILHVGAGTFKPVSTDRLESHTMHAEQIVIERATIEQLIEGVGRPRVLVGTTTVRTIESLYWYGVKLLTDGEGSHFNIDQWMPYDPKYAASVTAKESLLAVRSEMIRSGLEVLSGETSIIIAPGYLYHMTDILITNFHQPRSTLLLLVSAFTGDNWKTAYQYALGNGFRFLSYGDACLFFPAGANLDH